ncbi:MAG: hypothetical protein HUJ25_03265 [Crocinitomicaceae bacterium]|nr:hypothetical protein [Crocinitomicaceae bacterium]
MKYSTIILISLFFLSCGGSDTNDNTNDDHELVTSEQTVDMLNFSQPDSLIEMYRTIRKSTLQNSTEVHISGSLYFQNDDVYIINFSELWNIESYDFALVFGTKEKVNELVGEENVFSDIVELFERHSDKDYSLYRGNFEEAPPYDIGGHPIFKNVECIAYRSSIDCKKRIFGLNNTDLFELKATAYTMGEVGICEDIIGYRENFILGEDPKDILVEVVDNKYKNMDDCQVECSIRYTKLIDDYWDSKSYAHNIFITNVYDNPTYQEISSLIFYPIEEIDGDSVITTEVMSFSEYTIMDEKTGVYITFQTSDAFVSHILFEVVKLDDFTYLLYTREAMISAEPNERIELNPVQIKQNPTRKDMFQVLFYNDVQWYTTTKDKYPVLTEHG